jgi:hypothetical protein
MNWIFQRGAMLGIGFLSILLASCSTAGRFEPIPETGASLSGTVTYKKEPVRAGIVLVQGATAGAQGKIGEDGRYRVENCPVGNVTIAVTTGAARGEMMGKAAAQKAKGEKVSTPRIVTIPAKYADPAKSPVKTMIEKGSNEFNIVMD